MDFTVYVLKSLRNKKRYIGYTSKDALERLKEHNSGSNNWSSQNGSFELVYSEKFSNKVDAIKRENFLKSGQGRKYLNSLLRATSSAG